MSIQLLSTDAALAQPTLLELLLQEQGELSAVECFSDWHESNSIASATYQALMPATAIQSGQQYAFEVDLDACSGCKACVVACHTLNGLEETETWRKVGSLSSQRGATLPIVQHVTTACHHCVDPACLNGCPVQAYEKDPVTGIVRHLDDQCFGCKYCTMMCPYEVPQYSSTLGIVRKCDMCSQRLGVGQAPACVQACPNQAIRIAIVDVATVVADTTVLKKNASLVPTAPSSRISMPTTRYLTTQTREATANLLSSESIVDSVSEGHLPLVAMIVLTQTSVGMWVVLAITIFQRTNSSSSFAAAFATAIGIVGVHAALLHLGRPWLAFRAFLGWRTSWLSREAIGFGLFMGAAITATGAPLVLPSHRLLHNLTSGATAAIGVLSVMCTGIIYIATRRELWGYARTGFDFGLSMIGLGCIAGVACIEGTPKVLAVIGVLCSIAAASPKLVDYFQGKSAVTEWDNFSARSGRILRQELAGQWADQWSFHAIALAMSLSLCIIDWGDASPLVAFAIFGVSLFAQSIHRWLYFASIVYRRMPGAST